MLTKTHSVTEEAAKDPGVGIEDAAIATKVGALAKVLGMIRKDVRRDPELYLETSRVPHGGE